MHTERVIRRSISIMFILALLTLLSLLPVRDVVAQNQTPFLISPYYGSKIIASYFDHEFPTYHNPPNGTGEIGSENGIFTRYDGARWTAPTPVGWNNCTSGVNCYDGHDGTDFSLSYERIIAAASGTVTRADWANATNRNDSFGPVVEIDHSNNDRAVTGHSAYTCLDLL